MTDFTIHTPPDTAPESAKPLLEVSRKSFGRIPGLHAVMAEAPGVLEAYQKLHELVLASSFDNEEKNRGVADHQCGECLSLLRTRHTGIAKAMKVSDEIIDALRDETPLPNHRLEALRTFTLAVMRERGYVTEDDLSAFFAAGYEQRHVLEVIMVLSQKVISNYVNHIAETPPVDEPSESMPGAKKPDRRGCYLAASR